MLTDAVVADLVAGQDAIERGDFAAAIACFRRAHAAAPEQSGVTRLLANAHRLAGDMAAARRTLLVAFATLPDDVTELHALGAELLDAGAPTEAVVCFERVLRVLPRDPAALGALAGAKRTTGAPGEAWPLIQRALTLAPTHPAFLLTAAQIRHDLGDLRGALRWLDQADRARPNHGPTRVQRAYTTLLGASSAEGWRQFEARPLPTPHTAAVRWDGTASIKGASVLVTAEQGVGDQFQFLRFLADLALRLPARVVVECHADAVSLLAQNGIEVVARGQAPETDWHVPLLSLPHVLGLDTNVRGERVPYLRAPAPSGRVALPPARPGTLRLGLVWAGNPAFPGRVTRDLDPALLPELLAIPDVTWIALQQGEAGAPSLPALHQLPALGSWAETAAILTQLDGLVTTDTGIAHLAGALGVRTWVMLQHVPDWRWGLRENTTPWYPSLRLLRPARPRDWPDVVRQLRDAIAASIASTTHSTAPTTP